VNRSSAAHARRHGFDRATRPVDAPYEQQLERQAPDQNWSDAINRLANFDVPAGFAPDVEK
jgi:hypothetical protein